MTDIFISYSRKDLAVATILARTLEELGYSVWWDMSGLHGGQSFAQVIEEKLGEAKCAIVLWSPDSVKSNWVHSEASFADNRGILLTAVYREVQAPMPFNNRHNENLRGWSGNIFDEDFQKLLKAVDRLCPVPTGVTRLARGDSERQPSRSAEDGQSSQQSTTGSPELSATNQSAKEQANLPKTGMSLGAKATAVGAIGLSIAVGGYYLTSLSSQQGSQLPPTKTDLKAQTDFTEVSKALVDTPIDKPSPSAQTDFTSITKTLLESAKQAFAENRLMTPENNNVLYYARQVLKGDAKNQGAIDLLVQTSMRYHDLANESIGNKNYQGAENYLKNSRQIIDEFALTDLEISQDGYEEIVKAEAEKVGSSKIYKLPNNLTLLPIPAGSFTMGDDNSASSYEKPAHKVTFAKPFWMSKTEITFDQYDAYAKATGKNLPDDRKWGRGTRPVINVS